MTCQHCLPWFSEVVSKSTSQPRGLQNEAQLSVIYSFRVGLALINTSHIHLLVDHARIQWLNYSIRQPHRQPVSLLGLSLVWLFCCLVDLLCGLVS